MENLKLYKKGLLKKVFSNNLGDIVSLSQCCICFDNMRKPITEKLRKKGNIPYYGANGIQDYIENYIFNGEFILLAEDGGHFDEFNLKPIAQLVNGKFWVNNHAHVIQSKPEYNNKYIYYSLVHKDIRKYINGTSRAKLNQEDMWQIKIKIPSIEEQNRIANLFTNLDKKIDFETKKLQDLKTYKKGLLQKMFI